MPPMANYISCHSIACMTLQQIRYLENVLQDQPAIQLRRLMGSQISGKLRIEMEAESREELQRVFQSNNIHFDWVIRVEFDKNWPKE